MPEGQSSAGSVPLVVFDIDGTLLDSAPGIVAGFQHALRSVGFEPPDAAALARDLGPPIGEILTGLGLPQSRLQDAVAAYRVYYREQGQYRSRPYDGVVDVLDVLRSAGVRLGTATAKLTEVARSIIAHHRLSDYFVVVNGTDDLHHTKTETLRHTLEQLGHTSPQPALMVGDRHFDVTAARNCGVHPVAVGWGYGSETELRQTAAPVLRRPQELLELPVLRPVLEVRRR